MFRTTPPKYVYRPALLERPSMWRFVLLSALLHIWLVVLFGDAQGGRRDVANWGRTFFATLNSQSTTGPSKAVAGGTSGQSVPRSSPSTNTPAQVNAVTNVAPVATQTSTPADAGAPPAVTTATQETASAEPSKPIEFEKIPAIAVEVRGAVTPFSVAPIVVEPLAPVLSSKAPVIPPIPPSRSSADPSVTAREAGFAIYVPPIVERAAVNPTPPPVLATPTLPALVKPPVEREFASYVPPPVVPQAQAPSASLDTLAIPSAVVVAPPPPILQIAPARATEVVPIAAEPIAPLNLSPATKALEAYRPPAIDAAPGVPAGPPPPIPAAGTGQREATPTAPQPRAASSPGTAASAAVAPSSVGVGASALLNSPLPLPSAAIPATPASALPSTNAPKLDLDQLRRQAREVTKEGSGSRALLPFPMVAKETPKKDMEKIFDKALKRPDCKEAYADLGLLAVVPLLRDAAKDGGCKW